MVQFVGKVTIPKSNLTDLILTKNPMLTKATTVKCQGCGKSINMMTSEKRTIHYHTLTNPMVWDASNAVYKHSYYCEECSKKGL